MDSPDHRFPPDAPDAPAVNHAGGVARLMGDGALFGRVLARFRNEYRLAAAGIRTAHDQGDTALALRLVHTLKGAAGMIEAVPLRRQADVVERLLRTGAGDIHGSLACLQDELERVLRELDALALTLPERPAVPALRPAELDHAIVDRLMTLLDEGNGDAVDLVREGAGALAVQLGEEHYRQVAELVEGFDFDGALALLRERAG
ncbi:Hpt domain-containing protein [Telluria mixta]|uniref:Hpt domain-containing protein n=1 Tax=Telluria mixta TaxID=34071 RepID=A0ABT2C8J8_9BURK|nr:Hpt domain-containing protein [Telluria mixta]MCS0633698.1 Hpt domain-containing protein [Telluria mixta]WEM98119.1 Hpt domain-containing protein [Telluria mixta]